MRLTESLKDLMATLAAPESRNSVLLSVMLHDPILQKRPPPLLYEMRKILPSEQQWLDPLCAAQVLAKNQEGRKNLEEYLKGDQLVSDWIGGKSVSQRFENLQTEIGYFEKEYEVKLKDLPWRECHREMRRMYMPSYVFYMITSAVKSLATSIRAELFEAMRSVGSGNSGDPSQQHNASTLTVTNEVEQRSKSGSDFSI